MTNVLKTERFQVIAADGYGYFVVDTAIEADGETPSNVHGMRSREEAEARASKLNALKYDPAHAINPVCPSGNVSPDLDGLCVDEKCQDCCPHGERDHGVCLDCGHEEDPGAGIDRVMDFYEGDR